MGLGVRDADRRLLLGDEARPLAYGRDTMRDMVGAIERIDDIGTGNLNKSTSSPFMMTCLCAGVSM